MQEASRYFLQKSHNHSHSPTLNDCMLDCFLINRDFNREGIKSLEH